MMVNTTHRLCFGGPKHGQVIEMSKWAMRWVFPLPTPPALSLPTPAHPEPEMQPMFPVAEYVVCQEGHLHYVEPFDG